MQARVVVIGYGNPLRGDDGAGPLAARALERPHDIPDLDVIVCHQLTPELAETLAAADLAIFIDARADATPGSVAVTSLAEAASSGSLGHHLEPATLLVMARLYGPPPGAFLVTLGAASFAYGEGLSPVAAAALPRLLATIKDLIGCPDATRSRICAATARR